MELSGIYDCDIHLLNYLNLKDKLSLLRVNKYCYQLISENLEPLFLAIRNQPNIDHQKYKKVCGILFCPSDRYVKCNLFYKICLSNQIRYVKFIFEEYKKDILCYRGFVNYIFKKMCELNYVNVGIFLLKYTNISYLTLKECISINKTLAFLIQCTIKSKLRRKWLNSYNDIRYIGAGYTKCEYCFEVSPTIHYSYILAEKKNLICCCDYENLHGQWYDSIYQVESRCIPW